MVSPGYLLVGPDAFLQDRAVSEIKKELFGADPGAAVADLQLFDAENDAAAPILDHLRTTGFFGSKRLAVVRNAEQLDTDDRERVLSHLKAPAPSGVLILISSKGSVKKDAFLRDLQPLCRYTACYAPFENDLPAWVSRRAQTYEKKIEPRAAAAIIERLGKDLSRIDSALDMLSLYVHPRPLITAADVEALIGRSLEEDVYGLTEAVLTRNARTAFRMVDGLLRDGTRVPEIVGMLASQLEKIIRVQRLRDSGLGEAEIGARLKAHPFYLKKLFAEARLATRQRSEELLESLLECDEAVKTGKIEDTLALERMLLGAF